MLRPWDLKIVLRKDAKAAVFLQIAHAIIDEIKLGRLAPGTAFPGSRELAESLKINRKTVIQAYAELEAQGWVTSERTRGTFVSAHLPEVSGKEKDWTARITRQVPDEVLAWTSEGGATNNGTNRQVNATPNTDMLQEMRVESTSFSATVGTIHH